MTEQTEPLHLPFAPKRVRTVRGKAIEQESLEQRLQRSYRLLQAENQRLLALVGALRLETHERQARVAALEVEAHEWRATAEELMDIVDKRKLARIQQRRKETP